MNGPGSRIYPSSPLGAVEPGIPTGRDVPWEPLLDYRRAGVSETTIHGAVAWASGDRVVHHFGGDVLCYGRSMMKPLMIKGIAAALAPVTSWEQRAIAVASHNGTPEHVATAQSLLGEDEQGLMQTPLDVPLVQFGRQVRRPRRWYHCCSGEHAAILRASRQLGWSRVGYTLPQHVDRPGRQRTVSRVAPISRPRTSFRHGRGAPRASLGQAWPVQMGAT